MKRGIVVFLFVILFGVLLISVVSAINACCERTNDETWCQYTDEEECDSDYQFTYTSCEQTSYCQIGCCYSSDTGSCYENTPQATCNAEEGTSWTTEADCAIEQCTKGCCQIADQAFFVTEVKCKSVGSQYEDATVNFDSSITNEVDCLDSVKNLDFGCCVDGEDFVFTTRDQCATATTEPTTNFTIEGFHEGVLCSNDLLSSDCAKQQNTLCYNGKVYWADSCGNRENIYSSDTRASYNNGYVLAEQDSCTITGANDPDCGNCDYASGNLCGPDTENILAVGDYACVDLTCEETYENDASPLSGADRQNGESWCVYDARPGEGGDAVGSRHYRHLCISGEELTEPCEDFRGELCINGVLSEDVYGTLSSFRLGSGDYVEAACRDNRFEDCSSCNDGELGLSDRYDCCIDEDTKDCYWLEAPQGCEEDEDCESGETCSSGVCVSDEESYPEGVCVPHVPPGLKFWSESGSADETTPTDETCSIASTECTATWRIGGVAKLLGGGDNPEKWDLISENPDGCTTDRDWLVSQNTYCRSLGDCGAYYDYIGEGGFDGFTTTLYDEDFFFEPPDELDANDLGDWDYLSNVDAIDEGDFWGFDSPKLLKNPATYIAVVGILLGAGGNAKNCAAEKAAGALAGQQKVDNAAATTANQQQASSPATGTPASPTTPAATGGGSTPTAEPTTPTTPPASTGQAPAFPAPEVPLYIVGQPSSGTTQSAEQKVTSAASGFGSQLLGGAGSSVTGKITESAGCLLGSALPLPGKLIGTGPKAPLAKLGNWMTFIAGAYLLVDYLAENETTITYSVDCNLWQPPTGGDNCEVCNDQYAPCSEYKCRSLGASCAIVNEGTSNETCVSIYVNDVNSPIVEPAEELLSEGLTLSTTEEEGNKGYEINELIAPFTNVEMAVATDEPAQCKYSSEPSIEFDDMTNYFGANIYTYDHAISFALGDEITSEDVVAQSQGQYTIYIRCSDANGNANERDYFIRFKVDDSPDLTPPEVAFTSIASESYMAYGLEETAFSIYTDEPASCRWNTNDTAYEFMQNDMDCATSGFDQNSVYYGTYECATTLTDVAASELNYFYFRCADGSGNINEDSYVFTTKATEEPLEITDIGPSGDIFDFDVTLEVETEGGAEDGDAVCGFSTSDVEYNSMVQFAETNTSAHSQTLTLIEGEFTYYVTCQDIAGNRASNSTTFTVQVDDDVPLIESLYVDTIYNELAFFLDEDASCEYAPETFTYGDGVNTGQNTTEHVASLDTLYYYLVCVDTYGNTGTYAFDLSTWV